MAASLDLPLREDQASYLALATKSNIPGASSFTSPCVACLYNEYKFSNVSLLGFSGSALLSSTAFSKRLIDSIAKICCECNAFN